MSRTKKLILIGAVLVVVLVVPLVVIAQDAANPGTATVLISNFSPNAPPVDVYIDGVLLATDLPFATSTFPIDIPAGQIFVEVRLSGSADTDPALVSGNAEIVDKGWYEIPVMNITERAQFGVYPLPVYEPLGTDETRVHFFHAVPQAPRLEVIDVDTGSTWVPPLEFGYVEDPYVVENMPAGIYNFQVWTRNGVWTNTISGPDLPDSLIFDSGDIELKGGTIYSFAFVGGPVVDVPIVALTLTLPHGGGAPLAPPQTLILPSQE